MDDARDLIERLCTAAGMITEDVSTVAILRDTMPDLAQRIAAIRAAGADIMTLADAADVIAGRWG